MKKETEGVTCIKCSTVMFKISNLVEHLKNEPTHKYYKYGDCKGVIHVKLLKEHEGE